MGDLIASMKPYLHEYGYWAVFGGTLLENTGVPLPGLSLLIAASLLASKGAMDINSLLLIAWAAATGGGSIGYALGRFRGRRWVLRYGHYIFINPQRLEHLESFFRRYGVAVVLAARFIDVFRQSYGIIAGTVRMSWWRFFVSNFIGAALWVGFWGMLSYELGESTDVLLKALKQLEPFLLAALVIAGTALAIYVLPRRIGPKKE